MKKIIIFCVFLWSGLATATEYPTPTCYQNVPTSCSFKGMTLSLCNKEGKSKNLVFLLSQRMYIRGGNKFGSADGKRICTARGIKGTKPKRYTVEIE